MSLDRDSQGFIARLPSGFGGWEVLQRSRQAFLDCAELQGLTQRRLTAELMNTFRTMSLGRTEDALLAQIFIDLWFCSNFEFARWEPLLQINPSYAGLAVEACYYTLAVSGADGAPQLCSLLGSSDRKSGARPVLRRISQLNAWSQRWVEGLLGQLEADLPG